MPSYYITARKTSPITPVTVEALTREQAIQQVLDTRGEGEEIEILQTQELEPTAPVSPSGAAVRR
jgi:hypothetical protein